VDDQRIELPGSTLREHPGDEWIGPADPEQEITVTILLRTPASGAAIGEALLSGTYNRETRGAVETAFAADSTDMVAVRIFAEHYGLKILSEDRASRVVRVSGTVRDLELAFGVKIGWVQHPNGTRCLSYRGSITLPESIAPAVISVLGLDQRPVAKSLVTAV
jgi:kumamolisin